MQGNRHGKPFWASWFPVRERFLSAFDPARGKPFLVDVGGNTGYDLLRLRDELETQGGMEIGRSGGEYGWLVLQDLPGVIDGIQGDAARLLEGAGVRREKYDFFEPQGLKGEFTLLFFLLSLLFLF